VHFFGFIIRIQISHYRTVSTIPWERAKHLPYKASANWSLLVSMSEGNDLTVFLV